MKVKTIHQGGLNSKSGWDNNDFHNGKTLLDFFACSIYSLNDVVLCRHIPYRTIRQHPNCSGCVTIVRCYIFLKANVCKNW